MARVITDYLDVTTKKFPDKIAIGDKTGAMTFGELRNASMRIATTLAGLCFKQSVAVFLAKGARSVATFQGVAYSGNFYTPLDTSMPLERIKKIIKVLQPKALITDLRHEKEASQFVATSKLLIYEEMMERDIDDVVVGRACGKIIDTDLLYILFTSGSTGIPKGVTISHRAVIDYTEWVSKTFSMDETTIFANQAPFYFDNSILDIYQTLRNGSTMHIIPENAFAFPVRLLEYMRELRINTLFWVPSALCLVADSGALERRTLPDLRQVLFCGEVMPNKQLNRWRKAYPQVLFANLYGPTEITDVCSYYVVDRDFADDEPLPIGKPCENTDIIVLNEENRAVSDGEIGELCVRGTSLSYGYYGESAKTETVFVQNPLNPYYSERIYRTGDLVRYNEQGELIYVCRKDFQIKRMGHRIELGEIEMVTSALKGVRQSCCIYDETKKEILLFYAGTATDAAIEEYLSARLPKYMKPNQVLRLAELPLNANGKIDRKKLGKSFS